MNKTIWLINPSAMPPFYEQRIQTLKRAEYLIKQKYDVYIIGGSYIHNSKINLIEDKNSYIEKDYNGIKFIHVRNTSYYNNSILRIFSLLEFHFRLFKIAKFIPQPDYISLYATIPFSNIVYFLAKRLNSKLIIDVVDLWPESFVSLGLISKHNPILKLLYITEKWMYKKAHKIVFSMEGGKDYIIERGWDKNSGGPIDINKITYVNNGVDLNDFCLNKSQFKLEDEDLNNEKTFKVIYIGSIRLANGVNLILEAAKNLKHIKAIKFLIYGDGPERVNLEKKILLEGLTNVIMKQKWVELKYVPYILSKSSLNLLNYSKNDIFRFGGSQSKSFQYMASGKPICSNIEMAYCPIKKFKLGISKNIQNAQEYSDAILEIYNLKKYEYDEICENALIASIEYDYEFLTKKYIKNCLKD